MSCKIKVNRVIDYRGTVWTIEYQKRGLPHMHYLLFLSKEDNYVERAQVDEVVCAQLPNEELDPDGSLTELVKTHMYDSWSLWCY